MIESDISDVAWSEICNIMGQVMPKYYSLDVCVKDERISKYRACMRDTRWLEDLPIDRRIGILYVPATSKVTMYEDSNNMDGDIVIDLASPKAFEDFKSQLIHLLSDR